MESKKQDEKEFEINNNNEYIKILYKKMEICKIMYKNFNIEVQIRTMLNKITDDTINEKAKQLYPSEYHLFESAKTLYYDYISILNQRADLDITIHNFKEDYNFYIEVFNIIGKYYSIYSSLEYEYSTLKKIKI